MLIIYALYLLNVKSAWHSRTDLGEMKTPEPTMLPTIRQTPLTGPT